jgi:HSP20 family molecular chaperone IbpA
MGYFLKRRDPDDFGHGFSEYFDPFFSPVFSGNMMNFGGTDVRETQNGYEMEIDLPGFARDDIKIELSRGILTISAKKESSDGSECKDSKAVCSRRSSRSFSQSYRVGDISKSDVKARLENGVLTVSYPKASPPESSIIDIG